MTSTPDLADAGTIVWRPDLHRYQTDDAYADAVDTFVRARLADVSPAGVLVVENDGQRRLIGMSFYDEHGHLHVDHVTGRASQVCVGVRLDAEEVLP